MARDDNPRYGRAPRLALLAAIAGLPACGQAASSSPASFPPAALHAPEMPSGCSLLVDRRAEPSGSASGRRSFATIQAAVDRAGPGDMVCVLAGDHDAERVTVARSGTATAPIRIQAVGPVTTAGFVIVADHVALEGFTVEHRGRHLADGRGIGIYLAGHGLRVAGNTVLESGSDGIGCEVHPPGCVDVLIAGNTVRGADGSGILVSGQRIIVERNDVSGSRRERSSDADGIRFFGIGILIRDNHVHDISDRGYPPGQEPHTDCFQTFDNAKPVTSDVRIERNICRNVDHQCLIAEAPERGRSARIVFRDNICENNGSQGVLVRHIADIEIAGNRFLGSIRHFGVVLRAGVRDAKVVCNLVEGRLRALDADDSSRIGLEVAGNRAPGIDRADAPAGPGERSDDCDGPAGHDSAPDEGRHG